MTKVEQIKDELYSSYSDYINQYTSIVKSLGFDVEDDIIIEHINRRVMYLMCDLIDQTGVFDDVSVEDVENDL